jgi:hypothetical protein
MAHTTTPENENNKQLIDDTHRLVEKTMCENAYMSPDADAGCERVTS